MKTNTRNQILKVAKELSDGFKAADVRARVKAKTSRVSVMLWQLKKDGVLSHDIKTGVYKLTDVNKLADIKPTAPKPVKKAIVPAKPKQELMEGFDVRHWHGKFVDMQSRAVKLNVQYEDAMAVVRYLEDKLFKAIQHDARHGRNT